jgi:peptide/nickel transport system substrate-binding protein
MSGPLRATWLLLPALLAAPVDTLVVGILVDPVSLDPHRATDLVSAAVVANVCETLVRSRRDGSRLEAGLATTWATRDNRTWTFTLRQGLRFHDGEPLDSDAVVANLESLRKVRNFPGRAERRGPHVVAISLERPNAALLATLSQPFFSLQSPGQLGRANGSPVGTGPFRFVSARRGEVVLEANREYWGGAPRLERVVFRRFAGEDELVNALLAGRVDVTSAVGQERVNRLRGSPRISLDSKTGLNTAFLSLNNERRPFADRRVRQAIARALDRDSLVAEILGGHGEPADDPLPPALWAHAAWSKELLADRPASRRLLAEAGLPGGFETTLLAQDAPRPYLPAPLSIAAQIRDDLAQIGVRARVERVASWSEYVDRGTRGDYDMMVLGWQADTTDPNDFLSALLASESIGTTNRSRYRSAAMDALLKRGRMASGATDRALAYREAQELFRRDMPWVPLYHVSVFTAYRRSVRGLLAGPTAILRYDKAWKAE